MIAQTIYRDGDIEIRPLSLEEAPALYEAVKQSAVEIGRWEGWCTDTYSREDARAFITLSSQAWADDVAFAFNVVSPRTGMVLGSVAINQINRAHRVGNLGYWTRASHIGQGLAQKAAEAAAAFGFDTLGLRRLEMIAQLGNVRSVRVAEKLGARFECIARHRLQFRGESRDARVYGLLPADLVVTGSSRLRP